MIIFYILFGTLIIYIMAKLDFDFLFNISNIYIYIRIGKVPSRRVPADPKTRLFRNYKSREKSCPDPAGRDFTGKIQKKKILYFCIVISHQQIQPHKQDLNMRSVVGFAFSKSHIHIILCDFLIHKSTRFLPFIGFH